MAPECPISWHPLGLELKRILFGNNTTTRLQMRIWCIPLFPSRPSSRRTWWPYGFPSRMGFGNNNSESQSTVKCDPFSLLDKDDDECSISIENFYVYTRCSVFVHFTVIRHQRFTVIIVKDFEWFIHNKSFLFNNKKPNRRRRLIKIKKRLASDCHHAPKRFTTNPL
jgi:hypothetical protein